MGIKDFAIKNCSVKTYVKLARIRHLFRNRNLPTFNPKDIFHLLSHYRQKIFFIQIGANDGVKNDPIHSLIKQYNWSGILVEPMPNMFQKLKLNYEGQKGLVFENVGIADKEGSLTFYCLPDDITEPDWLQQIGSFDKEAFIKNVEVLPGMVEKMITKDYKVITLKELIKRNDVPKIDLLTIDAEGFEYVILKQLDEISLCPSLIFFEWGSMDEISYKKVIDLLNHKSYKLFVFGGDTLAIHNSLLN